MSPADNPPTNIDSDTDTSNFFKKDSVDLTYWDRYLLARPEYSAAFYDIIWAYHRSHAGSFDLAADVGTGPGQVAAEFAKYFTHTIASDSNETHLDVASRYLAPLLDQKKVTITVCSAENIGSSTPVGSVDLLTVAEAMPLIDASTAMQAFHSILKENGTLAIWFYGRPAFAELEYADKCQAIFSKIADAVFTPLMTKGGPKAQIGLKRAMDCMVSFLDNVELKDSEWTNVRRYKWNTRFYMPFAGPKSCNFAIEPVSRVGEDEKIEVTEDLSFWERQWDLKALKRFVHTNMPQFDGMQEDENLTRLYRQLGEAMGGPGAVRKITWPVVLILGTKR